MLLHLGQRKQNPNAWLRAQAHFAWAPTEEKWKISKGVDRVWHISYNTVTLALEFGKFKHIGIFPEHESQWKMLATLCRANKGVRVLNLFGYTGVASLVAAKEGAFVTHVDASKQTIGTVKENIALSHMDPQSIRLVCEDALKYAKRLVQRAEQFDVIVMDPPAFGRGPKGEIWKIEEKLPELVALIPKLLSKDARCVILNGYTAGYSARSFGEILRGAISYGDVVYGDVGLEEKGSQRILSTGIYAMWSR